MGRRANSILATLCVGFHQFLREKKFRIEFHYLRISNKERKKERKKVKSLSRVRLFVTPWTVAHKAAPSMEFSRQEYWHGLPFPPPGDLPNPGIEPRSPALQAESSPSEPPGKHKNI